MNYEYYKHFNNFWIPIYKRQVLNAKEENNISTLISIYNNIDNNWHLQDYKNKIFKVLDISYLSKKVDIDSDILKIYFKQKKKKELLYECY